MAPDRTDGPALSHAVFPWRELLSFHCRLDGECTRTRSRDRSGYLLPRPTRGELDPGRHDTPDVRQPGCRHGTRPFPFLFPHLQQTGHLRLRTAVQCHPCTAACHTGREVRSSPHPAGTHSAHTEAGERFGKHELGRYVTLL